MNNEEGDRRRDRVLGVMDAWVGIGVFGRLALIIAIIGGTLWLLAQAITLAVFLFTL